MHHSSVHYLGPKDVPYTLDGKNLVEFRRVELMRVAEKIGIPPAGTKNELLSAIVGKLQAMGANSELSDP